MCSLDAQPGWSAIDCVTVYVSIAEGPQNNGRGHMHWLIDHTIAMVIPSSSRVQKARHIQGMATACGVPFQKASCIKLDFKVFV